MYNQKRTYSGCNDGYFKKFKPTVSEFAQTLKPEPVLNVQREHAVQHFGKQQNLQRGSECFGRPSFRPPFKEAFDSHSTRLEFKHCSKIGSSLLPPPLPQQLLPPLPNSHGLSPPENMRYLHGPSVLPSFMHNTASVPIKQEVSSILALPIVVPSGSSGFPPSTASHLKSDVVSAKLSMSCNSAPSQNLLNSQLSKFWATGLIHSSISKEPEVTVKVKIEKVEEQNQEFAAGIIHSSMSREPKVKVEVESIKNEKVKEQNQEFNRKETNLYAGLELQNLKAKRPGFIDFMYRGKQCASCDERFEEDEKEKYRSHLDMHFQMNRKRKTDIKKRSERAWYSHHKDVWGFAVDKESKEPVSNFFQLQAKEHLQVKPVIPSVPASSQENESCAVCEESFRQFWVDDEEEWHLQNAVRHNNLAYHPACYKDVS